MNRKFLLLSVFLMAMSSFSGRVSADGNDLYLVYNASYAPNPNGAKCLNLSSLRSLSFGKTADRILKAKYIDNHIDTISTTVIDYLYIGSAPTKVENVSAANANQEIALVGDKLMVSADKESMLSIFSADGKHVAGIKLTAGSNAITISALPCGMYIAHTASSTLKFCK